MYRWFVTTLLDLRKPMQLKPSPARQQQINFSMNLFSNLDFLSESITIGAQNSIVTYLKSCIDFRELGLRIQHCITQWVMDRSKE